MIQSPPISGKARITVTSRLFKPVDFPGAFSDGCSYNNGGTIQKMQSELQFYSFLGYENKKILFTASDNSIANNDTENDLTDFIADGWRIGMTISVTGSASNNGAYTVTSVAKTVIKVASGISDETATSASVYDDTPITALDFYFNQIKSGNPESYLSLTDSGVQQKFSASGLDASDTGTTKNFIASTYSFAWVTNTLTVPSTGETDQVTIIGMGISGHKQSFKILHTFHISPFWTSDLLNNFLNAQRPNYFTGNSNLQYIFRVDGKFSASDVIVPYTGGVSQEADLTNFYNDNNLKSIPEYSISSVSYIKVSDSSVVDKPDINVPVIVGINIKSKNSLFQKTISGSPNTKFIIDFLYLPLNNADYQNTLTTLRQNLMNDRVVIDCDSAPTDGEYFGTDYQVITNAQVSGFSADSCVIGITLDFSTFLKNKLKSVTDANRYFAIVVTTQDVTIATTQQSDRVSCLIVNSLAYDKNDSSLIEDVDGFEVQHYPLRPIENSVNGFEGEPVLAKFPFRLQTLNNATLLNAGMQVVVHKDGEEDFVLDSKIFDSSLVTKLLGVQQINLSEPRNFITYEDDPYNINSLYRDQSLDVGTMKGFVMSYAFVLRYEYWKQLIPLAEQWKYPLFEQTMNIDEQWNTIRQNGWVLKLKFVCDVQETTGVNAGHVTNFWAYTNLRIVGETEQLPGTHPGTSFVYTLQFFNEDGVELQGINIGGRTLIRYTQSGDWSAADAQDWFGYIFADLPTQLGGINNRRFASTQYDSEADSPFSATEADVFADSSRSSKNITVNFFNSNSITLETIFDDTKQNWGIQEPKIYIGARLGYPNNEAFRTWNDNEQHLWNDNEIALFNSN